MKTILKISGVLLLTAVCACAQFTGSRPGSITPATGVTNNAPAAVSIWAGTNATPNSVLTAASGALFVQLNSAGTSFVQEWIKLTPTGNTGWATLAIGGTNSVAAAAAVPTTNSPNWNVGQTADWSTNANFTQLLVGTASSTNAGCENIISNSAATAITVTLPATAWGISAATNITTVIIPAGAVMDLKMFWYQNYWYVRDSGPNNSTLSAIASGLTWGFQNNTSTNTVAGWMNAVINGTNYLIPLCFTNH